MKMVISDWPVEVLNTHFHGHLTGCVGLRFRFLPVNKCRKSFLDKRWQRDSWLQKHVCSVLNKCMKYICMCLADIAGRMDC